MNLHFKISKAAIVLPSLYLVSVECCSEQEMAHMCKYTHQIISTCRITTIIMPSDVFNIFWYVIPGILMKWDCECSILGLVRIIACT